MKIRHLVIVSSLSLASIPVYAGFADTMRDLRNTLNQFNETSKEVSNTAKEWTGSRATTNSNYAANGFSMGQQLRPKINNLPLYQTADKSSQVINKLSKNADIIFAGNMTKTGLIEVTTEHGNGWIDPHLVQ